MNKRNFVSTAFLIGLLTVVLFVGVWQIKPAQASDTLIDSCADAVNNGFNLISFGGISIAGQSFTMLSSDYKITSAKLWLLKAGLPNGTGYVYLYAHSGTYGTSSVPTGSPLAQSEGLNISTIAGSYTCYELAFNASQQYTMTANAYYCIVFGNATNWEAAGSNYVGLGLQITSSTHSGNDVKYNTASQSWGYDSEYDAPFYVYGILGTATPPIFTVQSPNTTTVSEVCLFSSLISDNVEVDFGIFGTNNTGPWVNETAVDISAVSDWLNVTKTLNDTVGNVVQFIWYANDTSNNWANSTIQSLTITSGTYYLTINSLPVSVTYTINGTISGASVTASSGSPADIQTAVNTINAAGGGTVYVPAGDFTFNPPAVAYGMGVTVPIGVNIIGAGINVTILRESIDISNDNGGIRTYMFYLGWTADYSKTNRISGISFIGHVDSDVSDKVGIFVAGRKDFRVDHCAFQDFPSQGICSTGSRGVIDHCDFDNHYRDWMAPHNDSAFPEPYARWGYGIIVLGAGFVWTTNISTLLGIYDRWGVDGHPPVYIETCNFTRCRHAIASNANGYYVSRYNTFQKAFYGQIDVHGASPGGRGMESYNNTFDLSDESYSDGQDAAFQLRGGGGVVFNNTVIFNASYTNRAVWFLLEATFPYDIHDIYIWSNTARYTNGTLIDFDSKNVNQENAVLNVDYFLRAPSLALDGFTYTSYTYPHPLAVISNSGVTNSTIPLDEATYSIAIPASVTSGGYTYNFSQWQDSSTNTTIIVSLTVNTTVTATYTDVSAVSVSITTPTNTTYTSSIVFINFTASGGTIDEYWFNVKNGTTWIYALNQTYPGYEMAVGLANGDHYTLYAFANNTDGTEGYATVMFTVGILIVETEWGGYWGRWWGYP